jgi:hypothetical protein
LRCEPACPRPPRQRVAAAAHEHGRRWPWRTRCGIVHTSTISTAATATLTIATASASPLERGHRAAVFAAQRFSRFTLSSLIVRLSRPSAVHATSGGSPLRGPRASAPCAQNFCALLLACRDPGAQVRRRHARHLQEGRDPARSSRRCNSPRRQQHRRHRHVSVRSRKRRTLRPALVAVRRSRRSSYDRCAHCRTGKPKPSPAGYASIPDHESGQLLTKSAVRDGRQTREGSPGQAMPEMAGAVTGRRERRRRVHLGGSPVVGQALERRSPRTWSR